MRGKIVYVAIKVVARCREPREGFPAFSRVAYRRRAQGVGAFGEMERRTARWFVLYVANNETQPEIYGIELAECPIASVPYAGTKVRPKPVYASLGLGQLK